MSPHPPTDARRRRWPRRLAIGLGVVVVLAVALPFIFIHLVEGKAPAKLSLRSETGSAAAASGPLDLAGAWHVGNGSVVGYRVAEVLVGQHTTAVGRTSDVSGRLTFTTASLTAATFTTEMATVRSDQSGRDAQFRGRIMDTSTYPTSTFTLGSPVAIPAGLASGSTVSERAIGQLQLRGQTHPVTFTLAARRVGSGIDVQADIPVAFATWGIANPSFGGFVKTADDGTLEVLLHLVPGAGGVAAPTTSTTTGSGSGGAGGPGGGPGGGGPGGAPGGGGPGGGGPSITVPSTTTPSLTLPGS